MRFDFRFLERAVHVDLDASRVIALGWAHRDGDDLVFDVPEDRHIYLRIRGAPSRFDAPPRRATHRIAGDTKLALRQATAGPLPLGCQFWILSYGEHENAKGFVDLSRPAAEGHINVPDGQAHMDFALRLSGSGRLRANQFDIEVSRRTSRAAPKKRDGSVQAAAKRAQDLLAQDRPHKALRIVEDARKSTSAAQALEPVFARALARCGRHREAVKAWNRALEVDARRPAWRHARDEVAVLSADHGDVPSQPIRWENAASRSSGPVRRARYYAGRGLVEEARANLESVLWAGGDGMTDAAWALVEMDLAEGTDESALKRLRHVRDMGVVAPGLDWLEAAILADLGRSEEAHDAVLAALAHNPSDNLLLTGANIARRRDPQLVVTWLNYVMGRHDLAPVRLSDPSGPVSLDNLSAAQDRQKNVTEGPLVSVIVPVFNGGEVLDTALRGLAEQTWRNLEVLIVDDASTDDSARIAAAHAAKDPRFRLIASERNRGAYPARNLGLEEARGTFVTCHDADDWSHPQRIQRQVEHLLKHDDEIAAMSRCVTVSNDLVFTRRSTALSFGRWNFSSLIFRREPVLERIGFWDEVRFAADGEFVGRLRAAFGAYAVGKPSTGPLSLVRQGEATLTATAGGGLIARGQTLRREYRQRYERWHATGDDLRLVRAPGARPFPVPRGMVEREAETDSFDVILASDFRLPGGTTASNVQEILANKAAGLRTGLVQMDGYRISWRHPISSKIIELVDDDRVCMITSEQSVRAQVLVMRWPTALRSVNEGLPRIQADQVVIVANQTPLRSSAPDSERIYDPAVCDAVARRMFGKVPEWAPIGPTARMALTPHADVIRLSKDDWVNVLDVGVDPAPPAPRDPANRPVIGRHARDFPGKWPADPTQLLAVYPDDGSLDVRILGGADVAASILGGVPAAWTVYPFNHKPAADYLRELDVFVYYPDDSLNEAFGRTIIEAMAANVPVILPPRFEPIFGDAALYRSAEEVGDLVRALHADSDLRAARIAAGRRFVERHRHEVHIERLARLGVGARPARRSRRKPSA